MSKHTPGPWVAVEAASGVVYIHGGESINFGTIARLELPVNAALIAAAPELLRALKDLVVRCDGEEGIQPDGSNMQTIAAHAAIAKVEGK